MTGNNKFWRASLAGLASVAMLATMGVSAANADTVTVNDPVDDSGNFSVAVYKASEPYKFATAANGQADKFSNYSYGDTFTELANLANPYTAKDHEILTGYSYDKDGKNVVASDGIAVKGDTKLYAQSAKAFTVTFVGANGTPDQTIEVAEGQPVTADDYFGNSYGSVWNSGSNKYEAINEPAAPRGSVFVGWTLSNHSDSEDLYTGQAITKDTKLYPKFVQYDPYAGFETNTQNVAVVELKNAQSGATVKVYTLAGQAFPEYRADAFYKNAEWQADKDGAPSGTAYDFTAPVENSKSDYNAADLTLWGVANASDNNWTVRYHFYGTAGQRKANPTNDGNKGDTTSDGIVEVQTTADGKAVKPGDPAAKEAEFTGWYQKNNNTPFDFNTPVKDQANAQAGSRVVDLYAGWDTRNIATVVYYYNYNIDNAKNANEKWNQSTTDLTTPAGKLQVSAYTGKAVNYQTTGTAIAQPTGIEDYFQTAKDDDYGTYTSRKLSSWKAVLSDAPITTVTASVSVYANWAEAQSILLDANGGTWSDTGVNHTRWVTKADGQRWDEVVKTPARDGYNFVAWVQKGTNLRANLFDGKYYDLWGNQRGDIANSNELLALWAPASTQDAWAYYTRFGLTGVNKTDDVQKLVDAGYTEASAKAYVDAWYNLQDEFFAAAAKDGQARIDAFNALVPKYQAAEKLLVKSDVPVKPAPATKVPVYRLYNKYITTGTNHLFTTDESEYNLLSAKGWTPEGVVFEATSDKNATPVYRLYNKYDGSHHYTKDAAERDNLVKLGWTYEFVGFYAPADGDADLYRLYNQYNGEHLFTTDKAENDKLVSLGWTAEESGLKVYSAAK